MNATPEILRAIVLHTPRDPFSEDHALEAFTDGALAVGDGCILVSGDYANVRTAFPQAPVKDWRGSVLLPGLIDIHIHFPQTRIIGGLGWRLLDWLHLHALPEEVRMGDAAYAGIVAREFVRSLARHGTTTALVFGAHFGEATALLFQAAGELGVRVVSGLALSDRMLPEPLLQTPEMAYRISRELIAQHHGKGGQRYAVTPRFALSASEGMLEVCGTLLKEQPDLLFQTHLNENPQEIAEVREVFPWASNYLEVYDRYGLARPGSVFAHNVHAKDAELERLAASGSSVATCPCSNAALGSGIFPMERHLAAGARFALGTDVGAGTGFGILKEALHCYMMQRLLPNGVLLTPGQMLYLATRAGAQALGLDMEIGDFSAGKSADLVRWLPPVGTPLAAAMNQAESPERLLAALITQGGPESVHEVRVRGQVVPL